MAGKRGRPSLNIFMHNCGFLKGTKERIYRLYPSLTFTAAVRKIVEQHLNAMEAQQPLGQSYGSTVDRLLEAAPQQDEAQEPTQ
jgi:hypothetical protein